MSAETLRRAAALMRERAEAFRGSGEFADLWEPHPAIDPDNNGWVVVYDWAADYDSTVARLPYDYDGDVATHIASWHPAVALAVADWLDHAAARAESKMSRGGNETAVWSHERDALTVARAYLGESL